MDVFRALGFSEAVALPAICAVLNRMAKQDGKFLPRWSQLLRGVFLSQIILLPVIGILYVHESAFWILVAAAGSWFVSIRILDQFSFGMHESSRHPDFNEGSQHAPRNSHSQPTVVVNQQHQCAFFNTLPPEIRDNIYRHLLTQNDVVEPHPLLDERATALVLSPSRPRSNLDATVLRSCRRCYDEAIPILYGSNRFLFCTLQAISSFSLPGLRFAPILGVAWPSRIAFNPRVDGDELEAQDRLLMIRHLVLRLSALRSMHPDSLRPPGFIPPVIRTDIVAEWHPFFHPEPFPDPEFPLMFPALQDLELDFSPLELLETEGIVVQPFIRRFKRGVGLDKLEIKGLSHEPSLELFKKGLVRDGGTFKKLE